ncbi:MAG: hypothetical protein IKP91_01720 [Bacteroidaceae bacterium]|nr:hypothetical protein [Bacteroidaceae bacterium]
MKKYSKPSMEIAEVLNVSMIAASDGYNSDPENKDPIDPLPGNRSPFQRRW